MSYRKTVSLGRWHNARLESDVNIKKGKNMFSSSVLATQPSCFRFPSYGFLLANYSKRGSTREERTVCCPIGYWSPIGYCGSIVYCRPIGCLLSLFPLALFFFFFFRGMLMSYELRCSSGHLHVVEDGETKRKHMATGLGHVKHARQGVQYTRRSLRLKAEHRVTGLVVRMLRRDNLL